MATHIDHVVTEIIPENETSDQGEAGDKRWHEHMKTQATLKQSERQYRRLAAESFDD